MFMNVNGSSCCQGMQGAGLADCHCGVGHMPCRPRAAAKVLHEDKSSTAMSSSACLTVVAPCPPSCCAAAEVLLEEKERQLGITPDPHVAAYMKALVSGVRSAQCSAPAVCATKRCTYSGEQVVVSPL